MTTSDELAIACDQLNEQLLEAEKVLAAMRLGVDGAVSLPNPLSHLALRWRKDGAEWQLQVWRVDGNSMYVDGCRVTKASLEARIASAIALPELRRILDDARTARVHAVAHAVHVARTFVSTYRENA